MDVREDTVDGELPTSSTGKGSQKVDRPGAKHQLLLSDAN